MINQELELRSGLKLKNRLVKAAMTEGLADEHQRATPELARLYKTWADEGGLGMLITGNVQVDRRFLERPRNVVIDLDYGEQDEEQLKGLRAFAEAGKSNGTAILVQLSHGGRQSNPLVAKKALAPSAIALSSDRPSAEAVEISSEQIQRIIEKFAYAARVCQDTGFSGVQIHAAHGYLISSFLNPLANERTDEFGGSLVNRASILIEVIRAVREATEAPFTVGVKLNSSDFQKGGFTVVEAAEVAILLAKEGVDFVELSGGNYESLALFSGIVEASGSKNKQESTIRREAYFLTFAQEIIEKLKSVDASLPIMVTGGFRSVELMNEALSATGVDMIGIGRPLCMDPSCTQQLLEGKIKRLPAPEEYLQLPSILGWSIFQKISFFMNVRMGGITMTFFANLIAMGKGTFNKKATPNLITNLRGIPKLEEKNAKSLKGYKHDDEFIQDYLK